MTIMENPRVAESDTDGLYRSRTVQTNCADIGGLERADIVREQSRPATPPVILCGLGDAMPTVGEQVSPRISFGKAARSGPDW